VEPLDVARDDWRRIKAIASAALDVAPDSRRDYIASACGGDERIEHEVASLVAAAIEASRLFEGPAVVGSLPGIPTDIRPPWLHETGGESSSAQLGHLEVGADFRGTARYRVRRRIGSGGMGVVYEVDDLVRNQIVALKTLRRATGADIYRLKREFRALADIGHPGLVCLYELTVEEEHCFFTMELVNGANVVTVARAAPGTAAEDGLDPSTIDRHRVRRLLDQMLAAVSELHRHGKLHCDLKPSNILVTGDDRVVILDFGIASNIAVEAHHSDARAGTPAYLAPELQARARPTRASDAYALGVTLYEILTGRLPFAGPIEQLAARQRQSEPPPPSALVPDLPSDLNDICVALLRRDPQQRMTIDGALALVAARDADRVGQRVPNQQTRRTFVGRASYMSMLMGALTAARHGRPGVVCIHGPSGIGKSALIQRFCEEVGGDGGTVVLRGRCYEHESVPYKALDGVVDSLSAYLRTIPPEELGAVLVDDVSALVRAFPVLLQSSAIRLRAKSGSEHLDPAAQRRLAFSTLRALLAQIAERHPLVLVIDDLHWADADSTALLEDLLQPPDQPRLLMVLGFRTEEIRFKPFLRPFVEPDVTSHRVIAALEPLNHAESQELAACLIRDTAAIRQRPDQTLVREAGGNPFLIEQLAHDLSNHAPTDNRDPSLAEMLERRVRRLPEGADRFLDVLALCARPMDPEVVYDAAGLTGDERPLLAVLRSEHFVRNSGSASRVEVYHDRIRETLASRLEDENARVLHASMARTLTSRGIDDPEALYGHYRGAGERESAAMQAVLAAHKADAAFAFDRAASFYRAALELTPEHLDSASWKVRLGETLTNAGRPADAADVYLAAAANAGRAQQIDLRRRAAEQLLIGGHIDRGMAVLDEVLGGLSLRLARGPLAAVGSLLWRRSRIGLRGLSFTPRDEASIDSDQLLRVDGCWSVTTGLAMVDSIRAADMNARHLLLALDAGEPYRVARAVALEAGFRGSSGVRSEYERWAKAAATLAEQSSHPHAAALSALSAGIIALLFGEWQQATTLCDRARRLLREHCVGAIWENNCADIFYLGSLLFQGRIKDVCAQVPELLVAARDRGNLFFETELRTRMNVVWLVADQPDEGERHANEAMERWSHRGFHRQHYNHVLARVQTELYRGRAEAAWHLITTHWKDFERTQLLRVRFLRAEALYLRGRAALLMAATGNDVPVFLSRTRRIARQLQRFDRPWTDAVALLLQAGVSHLDGRPSDAAQELTSAIRAFEATGMHLHAAVARRRLAEVREVDAPLLAEADAWMTNQGIRQPARIANFFAPGFRSTT